MAAEEHREQQVTVQRPPPTTKQQQQMRHRQRTNKEIAAAARKDIVRSPSVATKTTTPFRYSWPKTKSRRTKSSILKIVLKNRKKPTEDSSLTIQRKLKHYWIESQNSRRARRHSQRSTDRQVHYGQALSAERLRAAMHPNRQSCRERSPTAYCPRTRTRERRKNNVLIFGLPESSASTDETSRQTTRRRFWRCSRSPEGNHEGNPDLTEFERA